MLTTLAAARDHTTPNATMRRYAGATIAVWRTEMAPGAIGPLHTIDREQTLVVVEGELTATIAGAVVVAQAGDAVSIPPGVERQLANHGAAMAVAVVAALPGGVARVGDGDPVVIPWAT